MESEKKPDKENPRRNANIFSQFFILWLAPLFWRGVKFGLCTDDLTKCLDKDKSDALGDELEQ